MKKGDIFLFNIYKRDMRKLLYLSLSFLFLFLVPIGIDASLQEYVPGEIIVKYNKEKRTDILTTSNIAEKNGLRKKEEIFKREQKRDFGLFSVEERGKSASNLSSVYRLVFDEGADLEKIIEEYENNPYVEYAHLNYKAILHTTPNDTRFNEQWSLQKIDAPSGWNIEKGSDDIIVAVVDTGIDYEHEDLMENMWDGSECKDENGELLGECIHGYNFFSDNKDPRDNHSHGTHVAGIISAVTDNNIGIAGVSWRSRLMAVKIFEDGDSSAPASEIAKAIKFAVENGANIISNSWGYAEKGVFSELIEDVIDYANEEGSLVIFSAGNSGDEGEYYPAAYLGKDGEGNPYEIGDYQGTLAVTATNSRDEKDHRATYGEWVNVSAPGIGILSTVLNNEYDEKSGTSMSAPLVSGLAALIWSVDSSLTREEVWQIIEDTTDNIDDKNGDYIGKIGTGRINVYSALSLITTRVNFGEENNLGGVLIKVYSDAGYENLIKEATTDESGEAFLYFLDGNYWYKATKKDYDNHYGSFVLEKKQEPLGISFGMNPVPRIQTDPATDISYNSATLNGELTDMALEEDVNVFFRWRESGEETWQDTGKEGKTEEGFLNSTLTELNANTLYEFKAVVEFEGGTKENIGDSVTFTTVNYPLIQTDPATDISYNSATLNGELTDMALEEDVNVFFRWRESGEETWQDTGKEGKTEEGFLNSTLTELNANTLYEFKAVVEFSETKEETGDILDFTTKMSVENLNFSNLRVVPLKAYIGEEVEISVDIENDSDEDGVFKAKFKIEEDVVGEKTLLIESKKTEVFSIIYSNEVFGAYSISVEGYEGEEDSVEFEIFNFPEILSKEATNISYNSAILNGELTDIALEESVSTFFRWRESGEETWQETEKEEKIEEGVLSFILENLTADTSYEFKVVVEFSETKEETGDILDFTTAIQRVASGGGGGGGGGGSTADFTTTDEKESSLEEDEETKEKKDNDKKESEIVSASGGRSLKELNEQKKMASKIEKTISFLFQLVKEKDADQEVKKMLLDVEKRVEEIKKEIEEEIKEKEEELNILTREKERAIEMERRAKIIFSLLEKKEDEKITEKIIFVLDRVVEIRKRINQRIEMI